MRLLYLSPLSFSLIGIINPILASQPRDYPTKVIDDVTTEKVASARKALELVQHAALLPGGQTTPKKLKAPAGSKAASARQPSPRTAFEKENIVSLCRCKDLCSNFVVIAKSYLLVDSYLTEASGLEPEICQERR